jgi:hypothetical protein
MQQHLFLFPTLPMAALVASLSMGLALLGLFVFRRLGLHQILRHNNAFTASVYPIIGGIYGVFLAFTVVIAWGQFLDAKRSATSEATYLSELWRDAQVFPAPARDQIQKQLVAYTQGVIKDEWRTMADSGRPSPVADAAYEKLWQCYYQLTPTTVREQAFLRASLTQLNQLGRERRLRILESRSKLPRPMWVFLCGGGALTIFFTFLFGTRHQWLQALVIALLAGLIGFSLFLVLSLQYPFTGDISIKPSAFQELLTSFAHRRALQLQQPSPSFLELPGGRD